jgi:long-subunit acyl-CoA synthetase (AMP-forming)
MLLGDILNVAAAEGLCTAVPSLERVVVIGSASTNHPFLDYEDLVACASADAPAAPVSEDDVAWLIYTSGTTGFPKGAMLTHRNLMTSIVHSVIGPQPRAEDRELVAMPLCVGTRLQRPSFSSMNCRRTRAERF